MKSANIYVVTILSPENASVKISTSQIKAGMSLHNYELKCQIFVTSDLLATQRAEKKNDFQLALLIRTNNSHICLLRGYLHACHFTFLQFSQSREKSACP